MRKITAMILISCMILGNLSVPKITYAESTQETDIGTEIVREESETDLWAENAEKAPAGFRISSFPEKILMNSAFSDVVGIAESSENKCGENAYWVLEDGVLTISGTGEMNAIENLSTDYWRSSISSIQKVVIGDGITKIGDMAFYNCTNLTEVVIGDSVEVIGEAAFYKCKKLSSVVLPDSVTTLESAAFADCTSLTSVDLNKVEILADYCFQSVSFEEVVIPATLTDMSYLSFYGASIRSYNVEEGNTVYAAADGILYSADMKTLILYPAASVQTSFTVPEEVTSIGDAAFLKASNLKEIDLKNVEYLGSSAFQDCGLEEVVLPDSLTSVDYFTFYGCLSLKKVTFGAGLKETSYQMFRGCSSLEEIDFGTGLETLGAQTFAYCTSLKSVELPENITSMGTGCFGEDYTLTDFTSKGLESIPYQAFWNCESLTNVSLNEGLKEIFRESFRTCESLEEVTIPSTVTYVADRAFAQETSLIVLNEALESFGNTGYRCLETVQITGNRNYAMAYEVLDLVNQQREAAGLDALVMDESLLETAMERGSEIALCFSHTRPDGSSCFTSNSLMIAENVAVGQNSADSVMESWMNSTGHAANILLEDATSIGIGCFSHNGMCYWVQCFGTTTPDSFDAPSDEEVTVNIKIAAETFSEAATSSGIQWDTQEYTYTCYVIVRKKTMYPGDSTQAYMVFRNAGYSYGTAMLNSAGISWSSEDETIACAYSDGRVEGIAAGTTNIVANMKYYSGSAEVRVKQTETEPVKPFDDVGTDTYYYDPVIWAVKKGVTDGVSDTLFMPERGCSRAEIVTFLWRASGKPAANIQECFFTDVSKDAYYYEAVLWAIENGITTGVSDTQFAPMEPCTRGQVITFLWRSAGNPEPFGSFTVFEDVPEYAYYRDAVLWAVENGITTGISDTKFGPDDPCTRGNVVTFLYRTESIK